MPHGTPRLTTDLEERPARGTTHRLNVSVASTTHEAMVMLAADLGLSLSEVIRRATQLLKLVEDTRAAGGEIHLVDPETNKVRVLELL